MREAYVYRGRGPFDAAAPPTGDEILPPYLAVTRAQHDARAAAQTLTWAVELGLLTEDGQRAVFAAAAALQSAAVLLEDLDEAYLRRPFDPPRREPLADPVRPCQAPGTKEGVARHKKAGEKSCEACRTYYNRWHAERYGHSTTNTFRPLSEGPIEHGTTRGYHAHRRRGDRRPCRLCKRAHAVHEAENNARRKETRSDAA